MRPYPEDGLIISCYLEGMKGVERDFISAVAHVPGVVALRVEGLDNIEFARKIAPDTFIIGLIKVFDGNRNVITPDLIPMDKAIRHAGADITASEAIWMNGQLAQRVMWDMQLGDVMCVKRDPDGQRWLNQLILRKKIVLATTFIPKAFIEVRRLRNLFPDAKINLEGGIETREELELGLEYANYVTIGKAINDPKTIIQNLLKGKN